MRAMVLEGVKLPLELKEIDKPEPASGEYRIKLSAAALNHRDVWIQKGLYAGLKFPIVLGSDGAGTIDAAGPGTDAARLGESVVIDPSFHWGDNPAYQSDNFQILGLPENGTFAEYVCVPAENLHAIPAHLSMSETAALPLAGVTAFRALFTRADCQAGDRVLVTGAGGGVAQFAVVFALAAGAEVWVTSGSGDKIEAAKQIGVTGGANYKEENWAKSLKKEAGEFDVIIDSAGGKGFADLVKIAKNGGRIALYGGTTGKWEGVSPQIVFWKQLSILGSTMGSPTDFKEMLAFVAEKKVEPTIDEVFPLENTQQAMDKMANGNQMGKLIIQID